METAKGAIMNINQLVEKIEGAWLTEKKEDIDVTGVYICDLLSWAMSHAQKGDAWITIINNSNVPAVASLTDVACVILPESIEADPMCLKKAEMNGITMIGTKFNSFEICKLINEWI
jgi:predicted transcriptional regulator